MAAAPRLSAGDKAPSFSLPTDEGSTLSLKSAVYVDAARAAGTEGIGAP